jgi:SnoaL-like domain
MAQANIDASQRVIEEAFGEGRLELLDELCAENFVDHDPIMGDQDVDAVKQTIAGYCAAFPDLSFTIDDIMACGDKRQRCPAGGSRDVGDYSLSAASPLSGAHANRARPGRRPGRLPPRRRSSPLCATRSTSQRCSWAVLPRRRASVPALR